MTTSGTRIFSDMPVPPGEVLEEELEAIGMTQKELAARLDRPPQVVNEIIRGKKTITPETALELEKVLGIPAPFWVNLEATYQMTIAMNRDREGLAKQEKWLREFPVREMESEGGFQPNGVNLISFAKCFISLAWLPLRPITRPLASASLRGFC